VETKTDIGQFIHCWPPIGEHELLDCRRKTYDILDQLRGENDKFWDAAARLAHGSNLGKKGGRYALARGLNYHLPPASIELSLRDICRIDGGLPANTLIIQEGVKTEASATLSRANLQLSARKSGFFAASGKPSALSKIENFNHRAGPPARMQRPINCVHRKLVADDKWYSFQAGSGTARYCSRNLSRIPRFELEI
jgi:hypothetical protein